MQEAFAKVAIVMKEAEDKIQHAFVDARRQQVQDLAKHEFTVGQLMLENAKQSERILALENSLNTTMKLLEKIKEASILEQKMCDNIWRSSRSVLYASRPPVQHPQPQQRVQTQVYNPEESTETLSDILYQDEDYDD
jgi:hypothetical protein